MKKPAACFKSPLNYLIVLSAILILALLFLNLPLRVKSEKESIKISNQNFVKGEVLVGFNSDLAKSLFTLRYGINNKQIKQIGKTKNFRLKLKSGQAVESFIENKADDIGVKFIEPNYILRAATTSNDPYFPSQAHLYQIRADYGWNINTGSASNVIANLDTGVDFLHEDLNDKIWTNLGESGEGKETNGIDDDGNTYVDDWRGWDFVNNDNNPTDDYGHGTATAGTAAAETNNSTGVAGVDWSAKIMVLKVLNNHGSGSYADLAEAIDYASAKGAKVISMSLGGTSPSGTLETAVNNAYGNGKVIIASSGNLPYCVYGGNWGVNWPAAYSNVVAVGSVDDDDENSYFSCSGPQLDVAAPGESILTTRWTANHNQYLYGSGTSFSAPQVAGLASLIWSQFPTLTNAQVIARIKNYADKVSDMGWSSFSSYYGYGRINTLRSLSILQKKAASDKVYLIFNSTKYWIYDQKAVRGWGFQSADVETVADGIIDGYSNGSNIYQLTRISSGATVYLIDQGKRKWVKNINVFNGYSFSMSQVANLPSSFASGFLKGDDLYILSRKDNSKVYLTQFGNKRWIANAYYFNAWGFSWSQVSHVSGDFLSQFSTRTAVKDLARQKYRPEVYYISNHQKRWIPSADIFIKYGFAWADIVDVSAALLNSIPTGSNLE